MVNVEEGAELSISLGDERNEIVEEVKGVAEIEAAAGVRPVGWHTPSAASPNTRRLLVEEGRFLYDSDAYNDDLPLVAEVQGQPHVVLPYGFDTNDMRFQRGGGFHFADDFSRYCIEAIEWLRQEGETAPKMLSIGLHLRIIGRPGRIGGLRKVLDHIALHDGIWVARRDEIAKHWRARTGLPEWPDPRK